MRLETTWRPTREQAPVLAGDSGIDVVVSGRGGGTSSIAALKTLLWALGNPKRADGSPSTVCVVGRELSFVSATLFKAILTHARLLGLPYGDVVHRVVHGQQPRIELKNGVVIHGLDGLAIASGRMRGRVFDFAWLDSAETLAESVFVAVVSAQRRCRETRVVLTCSSEGARTTRWIRRLIAGWRHFGDLSVRVFRWPARADVEWQELAKGIYEPPSPWPSSP